jgi:hypothetical protein
MSCVLAAITATRYTHADPPTKQTNDARRKIGAATILIANVRHCLFFTIYAGGVNRGSVIPTRFLNLFNVNV